MHALSISKHMETDCLFVRENDLITCVFSKPLPQDWFQTLRSKLGVLSP